jgi:hypothetical protein
MKVFLMHKDRDVDLQREPPANQADLVQDLERRPVRGHGGR